MSDARIYRYRLRITDAQALPLPAGAEVLSVGAPRDGQDLLDLWARVDPDAPPRDHLFLIVGTGNPLPSGPLGQFVGTVHTHGGKLVWHVFHRAPA